MAYQSPGERLLAGFLRAILDADFSSEEKAAAAEAIRDGRLTDHLVGVLEFGNQAPKSVKALNETGSGGDSSKSARPSPKDLRISSPPERRHSTISVDSVFQTLRRRKISKIQLIKMLEQLNTGLEIEADETTSMRELLTQFRDLATDAEWITLSRMISGAVEPDAYLRNIMNR
jgi:hypothetical protein